MEDSKTIFSKKIKNLVLQKSNSQDLPHFFKFFFLKPFQTGVLTFLVFFIQQLQ